MLKEFKAFLLKQNALALAIGVILGTAIGKVVSGIVDDLIMPIVGLVLPGGDWRTAEWVIATGTSIKYGDLLGRLIDFAIIGFVLFLIVRTFMKEKPAPVAQTKKCPECLEPAPLAAKRCHACGQPFVEAPTRPISGAPVPA